MSEPDLAHHGDAQLTPGLVDLAVNVRGAAPDWLRAALVADPGRWAAYPDAEPARAALAAHHGVPVEAVLPTAGATEAFTLVARAVPARCPVVLHPQFTEPEAALRRAGRAVRRVVGSAADGFALAPGRVPEDAELVLVGNPTNPTGVLHPADRLGELLRPGRVVVVDEAFMDLVPGELGSLAGSTTTGLVVVRSLTKIWGVAGLRAGYVVGDPAVIRALREQQPPWSVPTPALDALVAHCSPAARDHLDQATAALQTDRRYLIGALARVGLPVLGRPQTPFVLVDTTRLGSGSMHRPLAEAGFAVRRCDTFPGLGPSWLRLSVREPPVTDSLVAALTALA